MQKNDSIVVVLGTGGTIAGTSAHSGDNVGYTAAQLGVAQLVEAIPALAAESLEVRQVAQLDSKDMGFSAWLALAEAVSAALARPQVRGVVITHGTDTLEETAYFLQRVLAPSKPVVMVAAMRPASALLSDGPQNLVDALCVAKESGARGVVVVLSGAVHSAIEVRKVHPYRLDAFDSGDAGPLAHIEEGRLRRHRDWPTGEGLGLERLPRDPAQWPRVEIVISHVEPSAALIPALCAIGVKGIVVAGTGNGTIHHVLEEALLEAQAAGVAVLRCTRCLVGSVVEADLPNAKSVLRSAGAMTPVQARIELLLQLLP